MAPSGQVASRKWQVQPCFLDNVELATGHKDREKVLDPGALSAYAK